MKEIEFPLWFKTKESKVEFGVELELMLLDLEKKRPLSDYELLEDALSSLPERVYRDYYPYQLEIRTTPTTSIEKCLNETRQLYKVCSKKLVGYDIMIIPIPSLVVNPQAYCGMHIHMSYPDKPDDLKNYYCKAMGLYPFALSLADHSSNFEVDELNTSERMEKSRHISLPYLKFSDFTSTSTDNRKYRDVILSPPIQQSNRQRMKKPWTIEFRMFDTPSFFSYYKFIVELMVKMARHIRADNPMVKLIQDNYQEAYNKLYLTRELIINQRYGVNKVFKMYNGNVCDEVAKFFGVDYPEETQFEYREKNGLSKDINGYIMMAIEGGWL